MLAALVGGRVGVLRGLLVAMLAVLSTCYNPEHPCPSKYFPSGINVLSEEWCPEDTCVLNCTWESWACREQGIWCEDCATLEAYIASCVDCIITTDENDVTHIQCESPITF